jgi:hypothetical protein
VAILIDEYDAPFLRFMHRPEEGKEALRLAMSDYYAQIKARDNDISFVFMTGITKSAHLGLFSSFNTFSDISIMPKYGAIAGFTHEELQRYFKGHLEQTAIALKISESQLSQNIEEFYNWFCFDGITKVYNPFSTKLFFQQKSFDNFWFSTGTPSILAKFSKKIS